MKIIAENSYFAFCTAKGFVDRKSELPFSYPQNTCEKVGKIFQGAFFYSADFLAKNIRKPLFIALIGATAFSAVTVFFYPIIAIKVMAVAFPAFLKISPAVVKGLLFLLVQSTILGTGLKALGRLYNQKLLQSWENREIKPLFIGDHRVKSA